MDGLAGWAPWLMGGGAGLGLSAALAAAGLAGGWPGWGLLAAAVGAAALLVGPASGEFLGPVAHPARFHARGGDRLDRVCVGAGPPTLVLLHGLLGSRRLWQPCLGRLAALPCACLGLDLQGFGRSPWPADSGCYSVRAQAEAVRAELPPGAIHLCGHSFGGLVALELAKIAPAVVSVTLVSAPLYPDRSTALAELGRHPVPRVLVHRPLLARLLCSVLCQQRWLWRRPLVMLAWSVQWVFPRAALPQACVEDFLLHSYTAAEATMHQCLSYDCAEAAAAAAARGVKMVVVHGDQDSLVPLDLAERFASRLGLQLHRVPGGDHMLPIHHSGLLVSLLAGVMCSKLTSL